MNNKLLIQNEKIILEGFDKISNKNITFAFYPKGVVIFFDEKIKMPYYINVNIENKIIINKELLNKLKERNFKDINYFVETSDSYIQMDV